MKKVILIALLTIINCKSEAPVIEADVVDCTQGVLGELPTLVTTLFVSGLDTQTLTTALANVATDLGGCVLTDLIEQGMDGSGSGSGVVVATGSGSGSAASVVVVAAGSGSGSAIVGSVSAVALQPAVTNQALQAALVVFKSTHKTAVKFKGRHGTY